MAEWNPNPTKTSCLIIDGGATIIIPKASPFNNPEESEIVKKSFNNYSELIIKNGTLKFESLDSYNNKDNGIIRIGPNGKLIILDGNPDDVLPLVSECAVGSSIEVYSNNSTILTTFTLHEKIIDGNNNVLEWNSIECVIQ